MYQIRNKNVCFQNNMETKKIVQPTYLLNL